MSSAKASRTCPKCGGTDVVEILYGFPDPEALRAAERGEIELGGCLIEDFQPKWSCRTCQERFGARRRAERSAE